MTTTRGPFSWRSSARRGPLPSHRRWIPRYHLTLALRPLDPRSTPSYLAPCCLARVQAESEAAAATAAVLGESAPSAPSAAPASNVAPEGDEQQVTTAGGSGELPKEFVDHCTRLTRMEARVQKVEPYVPLQRMPNGDEVWRSIAEFYGVSAGFPATQLLAHNERLKTIHYVTAAARRALDASRPSALAGPRVLGSGPQGSFDREGAAGKDMLNVVVAVSSVQCG